MGSKIKSEHLYWLGRYTERVLISVRLLMDMYDQMIDGDPIDYQGFCTRMGIDNIYTDAADFCRRYLFDADDPDSIYCAMRFAYDNAIVLREVLTSEGLSYIQLALTAIEHAAESSSPLVELQVVIDNINAFRGSCYEHIDESSRNIIRCGSSVERIDIMIRTRYHLNRLSDEVSMLLNRLYKTRLEPDQECLNSLVDAVLDSRKPEASDEQLLVWVENLFPL